VCRGRGTQTSARDRGGNIGGPSSENNGRSLRFEAKPTDGVSDFIGCSMGRADHEENRWRLRIRNSSQLDETRPLVGPRTPPRQGSAQVGPKEWGTLDTRQSLITWANCMPLRAPALDGAAPVPRLLVQQNHLLVARVLNHILQSSCARLLSSELTWAAAAHP